MVVFLQIESPRKSVTTVASTPDRDLPFPTERDLLPPTDERDGDEIVKSKDPRQQQQFQFDVGSPQSFKEFQERALWTTIIKSNDL